MTVTVVDRDPPLRRLLGRWLADLVVTAARERGVHFVESPEGVALLGHPEVCGVEVGDRQLTADVVVSAVGDVPNVEWLVGSGLPVGSGGLVVDRYCRVTSDIVAAGDVTVARSDATGRIAPHAAEVDEAARFPTEGYRALVESQLHAVVIPEAYGGVGADALTGVAVAEEIARACATTQQVSGANELFSWLVLHVGSEEQKHRWMGPIAAGEALGAFALSEPEAGSAIVSTTTRAVPGG